jgi:hypothetical protein
MAFLARRRWRAAFALGAVASVAWVTPGLAAPGTMHTGFLDPTVSYDLTPADRGAWLDRIRSVGADRMRVFASWAKLVTRAPIQGEDTSNPSWPGYNWTALDNAVNEASARGLQPIVSFLRAPSWAEGPGRPRSATPGTWQVDAGSLGAFARAAALRYPGVRFWQAWNEPNLDFYLAPQWVNGQPFAPGRYRQMLNAVYDAVKGVNRANVVVAGGTAPFGDFGTHGSRMPPARFDRELFCVSGGPCSDPAKFDVLSHHPYSVGGPNASASNADDVSVPDLGKLIAPLRRAERSGRVRGPKRHGLWVTELSWDSSPPDPDGVPAQKQARWLEESMYVLWRSGVDTVIWFLARDQLPVPSFGATYQSGVFLNDGTPKPSATAFRFPFVADPLGHGRVRLWGKAPAAGRVLVQRRSGARWITIARFSASSAGRVFTKSIRVPRGAKLRAREGGATSLTWPPG